MKYKDEDYEYERRRRELEQRKRVRPDAGAAAQRRTSQSRTAQSRSGSQRTGSTRSAASGAARKTSQTAGRRPMGVDPYDRTRRTGTAGRSYEYEDMSSRKRQPASAGQKGKRPLSPKAKKKRRIRRALFAVEGLLLVLVIAGVFVISLWDRIQPPTFAEKDVHINDLSEQTMESMSGYRTIAVFGRDEVGTHSDVIMIVNINNETKEVSLTSVLRDTYWNVPDITNGIEDKYAKANNAYHTGGDLGALNALNKNLDLSITEYVTVNWYAVAQVVDLLGGMEIDVPESMMDEINGYITNTQENTISDATGLGKGTTHIKGPGLQTLDGVQTVAYCRIRHNNGGDDGRTQRQREVVGMILEKLKQCSPTKLIEICNAVFPEVSTNLTLADVLALVPDVGKYSITSMSAFPYHQVDAYVESSGSVKVPLGLAEDVTELHANLFGDTSYTPSSTVQQISNKIEELTGYSAEDRTE